MFNNQVALRKWGTSDQKSGDAKHESKFLALLMEIRTEMRESKGKMTNPTPDSSGAHPTTNTKGGTSDWRFSNPENNQMMVKNNRQYKWCTKDSHRNPQWCGQHNCMSKEEYAKTDQYRQNKKRFETRKAEDPKMGTGGANKLADFKIALSTLLLVEDFKAIESQF